MPDPAAYIEEDRYRPILANQANSPTLRSIYHEVYADDYPAEAEPFGFVTVAELTFLAIVLGAAKVTRLVDLGCGRGGPGLWIARKIGAALVGVDVVSEAVAAASVRAASHYQAVAAEFRVASATDTRLAPARFDGAVSVDALWMIVDKRAAFVELARILRPGGRLVFTTWEPSHLSYDRILESAGFDNVARRECKGSADRQSAVYEAIIRNRESITAELGRDAAAVLLQEASETPKILRDAPRLIISATRFV